MQFRPERRAIPAAPRRSAAAVVSLCAAFALMHATSVFAADDYKPVRGLGPTKPAGKGLLRVKLKDASTVVTHGLDPETRAGEEHTLDFGGPERQPLCAADNFQHVLYGYPADAANGFGTAKAVILAEMKRMNALLNEEALASGGRTADYKVRCDSAGEVRVDAFRSAQTGAQTTFAGVVSAAKAAGFDATNADYTIFFDSSVPPACGTATFSPDERLAADNANNSGGDYAVVYSDCWTDRSAMHENAHNQGAVQYSAPHSTGNGGHCNDGYDIMCYSDGGDRDVGMSVFCPDKMRFDCRYDSYFDTAPEPGEYLASHWNLGSPLNRFIGFDQAGPTKPACVDALDNDGDDRRDYPADPGCGSPEDTDEADAVSPPSSAVRPPAAPYAPSTLPLAGLEPLPPLPTLTMASARRYARQRIKRRSRRATAISTRCVRRTRTSATCRVRWRADRQARYRGKMLIRYRYGARGAALAASARVRKVRG